MKFKKRVKPANFGGPAAEAPEAEGHALDLGPNYDDEGDDPLAAFAPASQPASPYYHSASYAALATASPRTPARQTAGPQSADGRPAPPAWPIYLVATFVAALWALGPIAFALGYRSGVAPLRDDKFAMIVFGLLAVGPAILVFGAAYILRQGQKLAAEARHARATAHEMLSPAMVAAAQAGDVVRGVREEILHAANAADDARDSLLALREALASESRLLLDSAHQSTRSANELADTLGRERSEIDTLSRDLDARAVRVSDSITQHARMVAEASDLAETQLREAEAALSARAADLAAAANEASDLTRTAGEDLTRHIVRLETAGHGVVEQVRAVESGLSDQRSALVTFSEVLKSDHHLFSERAEAHAAMLSDFIGQARVAAAEMNDRAVKGGDSLRQLMADAAAQFRDLAETARAEREEFGQSTLQSLEAVSAAAAEQREKLEAQTRSAIDALSVAAEQTREAAARHAAIAREQVEQLSGAAFAAGQTANQVFEARLSEARSLVERSSEMVDRAGLETARKLEEGAAAARESLAELQDMLAELEQRAVRLPVTARGQVDLVRKAVLKGMEELTIHARHTAEEAQAIDAAFQDRVRRNFEMLSEAMRLMGSAAVGAAPPSQKPSQSPRMSRSPGVERALTQLEDAVEADGLDLDDLMEEPMGLPPAVESELRPRLRLTPTATDEEFAAVFEAAGAITAEPLDASAEGEWTWKDLLASIDGAEGDGERLQDVLAAEVAKMGVEPAKLLPKARIDEIAAAVQTGDLDGARAVVKRLAPAAIRRIGRRLATDEDVRRQVQVYVRRYHTLVDDAVVRDPEGFLMAGLLGDEAGGLYLLLDAAQNDAT